LNWVYGCVCRIGGFGVQLGISSSIWGYLSIGHFR